MGYYGKSSFLWVLLVLLVDCWLQAPNYFRLIFHETRPSTITKKLDRMFAIESFLEEQIDDAV